MEIPEGISDSGGVTGFDAVAREGGGAPAAESRGATIGAGWPTPFYSTPNGHEERMLSGGLSFDKS